MRPTDQLPSSLLGQFSGSKVTLGMQRKGPSSERDDPMGLLSSWNVGVTNTTDVF